LAVETAGGYCDRLIVRNTTIPCEKARVFVTARDLQDRVDLRICQGESRVFEDNTLLGQVELTGLPALARGESQIRVTFELDTSGMLNVTAESLNTGARTAARIRMHALPETEQVESLSAKHAGLTVR
jgi:molecular chaperone DnaK